MNAPLDSYSEFLAAWQRIVPPRAPSLPTDHTLLRPRGSSIDEVSIEEWDAVRDLRHRRSLQSE